MGEWTAAVAVADGPRTRVAEMAASDRPRERLERLGAQALTGAGLLEIKVLDHVVLGRGRYVSMRDRGLGFP